MRIASGFFFLPKKLCSKKNVFPITTHLFKKNTALMKIKILILFTILTSIFITSVCAQPNQEHNLATQYYSNGEYDKAADLFEKLYDKNPGSSFYYRYYYNCLVQLREFKKLDKVIKKQIKKNPEDLTLYVDLGYMLVQDGDIEAAYDEYNQAINKLPADRNKVIQLANSFQNIREYDYAVKAYEAGKKNVKGSPFYYELGVLYRQTGNHIKMLENFLDYLAYYPAQIEVIQNILQDDILNSSLDKELQKQLYKRIQIYPEEYYYNELLIWLFVQKKDFESAFIQVKALDKRLKENGTRVFDLALAAMNEKNYNAAIQAFQYLIDIGDGELNSYYFYAREAILNARKEKITLTYTYTNEDIIALEKDYKQFLVEFGNNKVKAATTIKDLAHLQAFYLHNLPEAIKLMEEIINLFGLNEKFIAECKLDLGDYYLMTGEIWEATLLYSQVDKKMKDEALGEMARFKNAKLSYYQGDFGWAQGQLNVLKASTSELIANDALNLSVFITSNLGLDTSTIPMQMYARADLLAFQNKFTIAIQVLDSISDKFPIHELSDDILWLKANIYLKQSRVDDAVKLLEMIYDLHKTGLLADDALIKLGKLYELHYLDNEKAMKFYETLFVEFKGSIFAIEARDRFRVLRGDKIN